MITHVLYTAAGGNTPVNVMFYGSWELMGSAIADRLSREGHSVYWMTKEDDTVHATLWNKRLSGKIYRGSFTAEKLRRILSINGIDTIVYLTGELREQYGLPAELIPQNDELCMLLNVLKDYPLRCFLYLSSLELDAPGSKVPKTAALAGGEALVESYAQTYNLRALTLRLGAVYGDCAPAHMGCTGRIIEQLKKNEKPECLYGADEWLEVSECRDAAMAVYQLLLNEKTGMYRLLGGHPVTMREYYGWIASAMGAQPDIQYLNQRKGVPRTLLHEDNRLRADTGWLPFVLMRQKGAAVLARALSAEEVQEERRVAKSVNPFTHVLIFFKREPVRKLIEIMLLFALTLFLLRFQNDIQDLKYVDIRLMFVAVSSAVYGVRYGVLAVLLACVSYISSLRMSQIDTSYLIYNVDSWIPFLIYIITGTFVGYLVSRSEDEQAVLSKRLSLLSERFDFLKDVHRQVLEVKDKLQLQILNSENSFGHAYEIVKELDSLTPNLIFLKTINVLERVSGSRKAALYRYSDDNRRFARLEACSPALREHAPNSLELSDYPDVEAGLDKNNLFVNLELKPDYPDYVAPVYHDGKIYCLLMIYGMDMNGFTEANQTLIRITAGMIENSLSKALEYEKSHRADRYLDGTRLLNPKALEEMRRILATHFDETFFNYMIAKVLPQEEKTAEELTASLSELVRASDYIGMDETGAYYAILMNIKQEQLDTVSLRFAHKGLKLKLEEAYD